MLSKVLALLLAAATTFLPVSTYAQNFSGYSSGFKNGLSSQAKSYRYMVDPTGTAPARKVHAFSIGPGCTTADDCLYQSVRSQLHEKVRDKPANDGWYGWSMYIPQDFTLAEQQPSKGYYTFAQWKNHGCPHVSFRNMPVHAHPGVVENVDPDMMYIETSIQLEDQDCTRKARVPVISMKELRGGWHKFEVYAEWSHGDDGRFVIYIDGVKRVDHTGSNQTVGWDENYFTFGLYLCCTNDAMKVKPTTVYYANVSKSKRRENLK